MKISEVASYVGFAADGAPQIYLEGESPEEDNLILAIAQGGLWRDETNGRHLLRFRVHGLSLKQIAAALAVKTES